MDSLHTSRQREVAHNFVALAVNISDPLDE